MATSSSRWSPQPAACCATTPRRHSLIRISANCSRHCVYLSKAISARRSMRPASAIWSSSGASSRRIGFSREHEPNRMARREVLNRPQANNGVKRQAKTFSVHVPEQLLEKSGQALAHRMAHRIAEGIAFPGKKRGHRRRIRRPSSPQSTFPGWARAHSSRT